ncbi:MAG: outer membrane protein assembly factor BamD [Prevotella sp.]|nr:outer membrane protein assembly factor BamD [Prevotella sp.]MBR1545882.1 outer membrane protein assembly factor BamD [Prevotella sp.]
MKKGNLLILCMAVLLSSCASEFNKVYKTADNDYKYEFAKQCFAMGKYQQASTLLQDLVLIQKGRDNAQECLYLLGMAQYGNRDYESASATFKKYYSSYPKGTFAEQASFYVGQSLYQSAPEPRLDQTPTVGAINAYQQFLDLFPDSELRPIAQQRLFDLQDNLVQKEYLSAELYYNLGGYFGNINANTESNYEACIITAQNALKTYPFTKIREKFSVLIMKSKFELAENSSEEKKLDRYRDAEDECYGFLNEYPESKECATAEKFIAKCKKITKD